MSEHVSTQPRTRENLAWAAGIIEGEGTISGRFGTQSRKRDRGLVIKLKMADQDVIERFHQVIGFGQVTGPYRPDGIGSKPLWVWQTGSFEHVQAAIGLLWSWLHKRRREQARRALRFHLTGEV